MQGAWAFFKRVQRSFPAIPESGVTVQITEEEELAESSTSSVVLDFLRRENYLNSITLGCVRN